MQVIVTESRRGQVVLDFVRLTKPRIVALLVWTALVSMTLAARGWPPAGATMGGLIGLALSVGGAHSINMAFDRDIDATMRRTCRRPVPMGRITVGQAYAWGLFLEGLSLGVLLTWTNPLTAALSLTGFLYYAVLYTMVLKRRTSQNIVIGGAAGAFPPLIGWAAVTGHLSWLALGLFGVVFLWTPPHFWALALARQDEYREAAVPMLPVTHGWRTTIRQMVFYTLLLWPLGWVIEAASSFGRPLSLLLVVLNGGFTASVFGLGLRRVRAMTVFRISLVYLAMLFGGLLWLALRP
ncbi:MAG: heme o synthase [Sulfobacillus sp.]|nr:heme o synthase [Sulfobacillus sp.]